MAQSNAVIRFLTGLPPWGCFLVILIASAGFSCLGLAASRVLFRRFRFPTNQSLTGPLISASASTQAFFVGFVIVNLWVGFRAVESNVLQESRESLALHHDIEAYPQPVRDPLNTQLRAYVVEVAGTEWKELGEGRSSAHAAMLLESLDSALHRPGLPVIDPAQRTDMLHRVAALQELRSARLRAVTEQIQPVIWVALVGLAALLLITTFFMDTEHVGLQYSATAVFATSLAFGLFIAVQLDFPFVGDTSVSAKPLIDIIPLLGR